MSANKSNELMQHASYSLNLIQLKMLNKIIDIIDSHKKEERQFYSFDLKAFITDELNMDIGNYTKVKNDLIKMRKKSVSIVDKNNENKKTELYSGWLSSVIFTENTSIVQIEIPTSMNKYYYDLSGYYTAINAKITYGLRSKYSIRLYELIASYKNETVKKNKSYINVPITYSKLRTMLNLDDKIYKRYNDFKKKVLEIAKKELKDKNTDIQFDYDINGRGKNKFIIFKIYNVAKEMEKKEARKKQELINNSDNIDKQIYTDIEQALKDAGVTPQKTINNLMTEYDEMHLRRNIEYSYNLHKKEPKNNLGGYIVWAIKNDQAMKTYKERKDYKEDKVKNPNTPLPIPVDPKIQARENEKNTKNLNHLLTNEYLKDDFLDFLEKKQFQTVNQFDENFQQAILDLENKHNEIFKIQFYDFLGKFLAKRGLNE